MKKNTLLAIISVAILAAGATLCFPQLRLFFKYGTAAIIYRPPVIRENVTHIACIGDSITYGAGVADETGTRIDEYSWPYILEEKFGEQVQIHNRGHTRDQEDLRGRLPRYDKVQRFEQDARIQ